jgi:hypothetical protein
MFFVLKFELILIIGSNNVVTEGARKVYRGRRVGQGCNRLFLTTPRRVVLKSYHTSPTEVKKRGDIPLSLRSLLNSVLNPLNKGIHLSLWS